MLESAMQSPGLNRYLISFKDGDFIVVEGDDSQDLFILASGKLDVLKGSKKIYEITERGTIFGEMSFLLGDKRSATVRAKSEGQAFRIPKEEITTFLQSFPQVAGEIAKILAKRLGETTQVLHGLKETCDQLPDAVLLTDEDGNIFSWNTAAKNLYGRSWDEMHGKPVEDLYVEPEEYQTFLKQVQANYAVRERVLKINHPEKGTRYVSTSTTLLYDGHHNFKGVLSVGRDITAVHNLERRYRRIRNWLAPACLALFIALGVVVFGRPHFSQGFQSVDEKKLAFRNELAKDYVLLKSLLLNHFAAADRQKTRQLMKEYFSIQNQSAIPYTGLVLLDDNKEVFDAYSRTAPNKNMVGESYAGIAFRGDDTSIHKVLTLYRVDEKNPMGMKGLEISFPLHFGQRPIGWLVFQMDMELLRETYDLDAIELENIRIAEPS